ncbi:hypothetical protein ABZ470_19690 [Streptosporangium sp. NPDC020072]|uniref:hypothetical protein n=1 Tax=unclassified Streptosporangium TaxID=2632669 RepID=UPI00331911BF
MRLVKLGASVRIGVLFGAVFGAATSLVNATSNHYADLESRVATTSGASAIEIVSVMIDSGWAWAGLAVAMGWLMARTMGGDPGERTSRPLVRGAVAGAVALLAATAAYAFVDTVWRGEPLLSWYLSESPIWWVAGVVLGAPLGAVGACAVRPGAIGLLARMVVPVGAAVQMVVLPPGRNERITTIGQTVVWTLAALFVGFVGARFLSGRRSAPPVPEPE